MCERGFRCLLSIVLHNTAQRFFNVHEATKTDRWNQSLFLEAALISIQSIFIETVQMQHLNIFD